MQELKEKTPIRSEVTETYASQGTKWQFGFTPSAEIWNGRLAMLGFLAATLTEIFGGQGYLHFWGFLSNLTH
jgi:Chlorophyll A-B binding protein